MYDVTDSSRISGIDWDGGVLTVQFKKDGAVYEYQDVGIGLFQEFLSADSKGRFFDANIRGNYEYSRRS